MLRELTKHDWQRILGIPDERVPEALILRGTRNLRMQSDLYRQRLTNVMDVGSPNGLVEDVLIGEFQGRQIAYASVYGAAMASEVTHLFGVLGTRFVLQSGCCGAWAEGIQAGDLFVPSRAFCGEGAAQYYVGEKTIVAPTLEISPPLEIAGDLAVCHGGIYTTAALFAEGSRELNEWADSGWEAVDMETASTLAVAEHFQMQSASILYVFDNPRLHGDIILNELQKDDRRRRGNAALIEWTFDIIGSRVGASFKRTTE